jgi:ABC-type uncharacterized transport system involved in gliding motility auxiliary subunit
MEIINKIINNKSHKVIAFLCFIIIFFALIGINFVNNKFFSFIRLDLTHNKIFTLSKGSQKILSKIDEPITLKLFFSKQLAKDNPFFLSFASRVEEFLKLYQKLSNKKIMLKIIDPAPFTEYEDQAVYYGLQGVPVNGDGAELYFGLVGVNSTIGKEVIPFLQPAREGYLEYDITQLIYKLSNKSANKISVISSLPIQGDNGLEFLNNKTRPWLIWQQIQQQFDAKILTEEKIDKIPEDIKVLLLINSTGNLPLKTATAIDQFVMRGGHILLFLDSLSEFNQNNNNVKTQESNSNSTVPITKLLDAWGLDYDPNQVIASRSLAKQVKYSNEGKDSVTLYPLWLDVGTNHFAKNDVTTADLSKLTFATPGCISQKDKSTTVFSPLITITDVMLINKEDLPRYKSNPLSLLKEYQSQTKPAVLAARITGEVKSAFNVNKVAQTNIVVIANADFLYDHFWATSQNFLGNQIIIPNSGNGTFVMNVLDNLTGSDDLISIRNKDSYFRGFDKIREIEINSQNKFQQAENALLKRLSETKQKLSSLEQNNLTSEHRIEEEEFRKDLIQTRKQLREVRRSLREDILSLENKIKVFTILLIPSLILTYFVVYTLIGSKFSRVSRYKRYDKKFK